LEMPGDAIAMRMISSLARINQQNLRTGQLTDDDWARIPSAVSILSEAKLFIDDTPSLSPSEMRSRARRIAREHGQIGLIMVDYLQLMTVPGSNENRTNEVSEISRSLKALAKEMNCPVVALSQLSRALEQRADKRPVMSDLRE
jgi:replicative DNA helicase